MKGQSRFVLVAVILGLTAQCFSLSLTETSGKESKASEGHDISRRAVIGTGSLADLLPEKLTEICQVCANSAGNVKKMTCPSGYQLNRYSNTCIRVIRTKKSWEDAKNYCVGNGERLATFETLESAFWFINLRKSNKDWTDDHMWVGGKVIGGVWRWTGKSTDQIDTIPWGKDQPQHTTSQECLVSWRDEQYTYHDWHCDTSTSFVCEKLE